MRNRHELSVARAHRELEEVLAAEPVKRLGAPDPTLVSTDHQAEARQVLTELRLKIRRLRESGS
jgi:hypothetical protein